MPSRYTASRRGSDSGSDYSDDSHLSCSTAPTFYSAGPSEKHRQTDGPCYAKDIKWHDSCYGSFEARSSAETYASTTPSEANFFDDDLTYEEPEYLYELPSPAAQPSMPHEFAELFPSTRRMRIRHDDTIDGNMNLRVDTEKQISTGRKLDLTLFHLRMHDLKNRDFSLRRYCRESGREVCHSSRKYTKPVSDRRPGLQRSMSNALASLRYKSESKTSTRGSLKSLKSLKRQDSGYDSMSDDEDESEVGSSSLSLSARGNSIPLPTNTTNLEFSNYAHVDLKRRGAKSSKRYEFEYWGTSYIWRRVAKKTAKSREISYHLYSTESFSPIAHIVPTPMTPSEARAEESKGGWVPPCSMWVSDQRLLSAFTDVADVVVATGLMALVDDCIKSRWHRKDRFQFPIPMPTLPTRKINMEYVGPKRLIDEVFNRRGNTATRHPTPLRQTSVDA